ncbi:MAG: DUF4426 domain-containing protein [Gammaproteobacteria bacterium]|nr:MAG: DUF4426 domain-containing protein [Gammaproteobacteria bacterium]
MQNTNKYLQLLGLACLCLVALGARAESSQDFGDYVVHFNALTTDLLPPKVATEYKIKRSGNHALLNVVVLRKVLGAPGQPVSAAVTGSARTLTGQQRELNLREIREPNAIYYIADFGVGNEELLHFQLDVRPEGESESYQVQFRQQFFTR